MSFKITYKLEELPQIIPQIISKLNSHIILLDGEMGSGKTTLVKHIAQFLKTVDEISSPTFSLVNEYQTPDKKIYHFDLYRLNNLEEALDFGFEEYLDEPNALVFIEWAEIVEPILPENSQKIRIFVKSSDIRIIEIL